MDNAKPAMNAQSRLKELAATERPQERLQRLGAGALSDVELLAMLLRSGTRGHDVLTLAGALLREAGSLGALIGWRENDFKKLKGIGRVKALQLLTVMEVARRVLAQQNGAAPVFDKGDGVAAYMRPFCAGAEVEKFWILCLNRKNRLLKLVELSSGTATQALAGTREIFREALREGAVGIICVHNHPSGDPMPSAQDIQTTRQIREGARVLGVDLVDHVIVGEAANDPAGAGWYSFKMAGLL
ncbi:DNA repair protein RadC [Ereboglobus sp. PH5-10]|uniref:RadC family protein n=1 Tax=Ereboglobus sp. PH5-10 TaxID=2940629 RepID=UPI002404EB10|nr:DNA repair protein RadC [Ereboglobus sp. PH5-10]MDF9827300.1 DNA repair protein RadC [Ereboglobus sp. PH5-10]